MKFNRAALTFAREQAGLSKPALAKKATVGLATLYGLEDGTGNEPTSKVVTRLAAACDVDWRFFYDDNFREVEHPSPAA